MLFFKGCFTKARFLLVIFGFFLLLFVDPEHNESQPKIKIIEVNGIKTMVRILDIRAMTFVFILRL
jgi:hypothetical protein